MTTILICLIVSSIVTMVINILFSPEAKPSTESHSIDYGGPVSDLTNAVKALEKKIAFLRMVSIPSGETVTIDIYKKDYDFVNTLFPKESGYQVVIAKENDLKVVGGSAITPSGNERVEVKITKE